MLLTRVYAVVTTGALSIYAIRTFSVNAYGRFATAFALITIFGLISEMGISAVTLRELTMRPDDERSTAGVALWAEVTTSVLAIALMFPLALLLSFSRAVITVLVFGAGIILFQGLLAALEACFQARRLLVYAAYFWATQATVTTVVGFAAVAAGAGPSGLAAAMTLGYAAATPVAFVLVHRRLGLRPNLRGTWRRVFPFVWTALPIAATGGMSVIYDRVDVLMLSKLDGSRSVAIYNVPLTILQYSMVVPAIVATAFFPVFVENLRSSQALAQQSFDLLARIFLLISVPVAIVLTIGGEPVLTTIFGDRYRDSAQPLSILAWSIVLGFFNYLFWYALLAAYRERAKLWIMTVGLALNVGLNAVLIPASGARGAAISLIASDVLIVWWQGILIRRHLFEIAMRSLVVKPLIAGVAAFVVALALLSVSDFLASVAAGTTYICVLLGARYISLAEWEPLLAPVRIAFVRFRA